MSPTLSPAGNCPRALMSPPIPFLPSPTPMARGRSPRWEVATGFSTPWGLRVSIHGDLGATSVTHCPQGHPGHLHPLLHGDLGDAQPFPGRVWCWTPARIPADQATGAVIPPDFPPPHETCPSSSTSWKDPSLRLLEGFGAPRGPPVPPPPWPSLALQRTRAVIRAKEPLLQSFWERS